jgi:D-3-phosphoglycerate dehydrogenase
MKLAEQLGSFAGQITKSGISSVSIEYEGVVASLNTRPLSNIVLMGLLKPSLDLVNMVNAPVMAKDRGIKVSETRREAEGDFHTLMRLKIETAEGTFALAGTLFSGKPRLVEINNLMLEAELTPRMLFVRNEDKPGFIGRLGTKMGEAKINIANFNLGRNQPGANAVCLVAVDGNVPPTLLDDIRKLPGVVTAQVLEF